MKYSRKAKAYKVANQVLASWGDSSRDSNDFEQGNNISMMVMEDDVQVFDSLFSLMADIDDDEDEPVTFLDIKENLKNYSPSKLRSLAFVLVDYMDELLDTKKN